MDKQIFNESKFVYVPSDLFVSSNGSSSVRWEGKNYFQSKILSLLCNVVQAKQYTTYVSRACLKAQEALVFLMLKYAFSLILETLFLTPSSTPKTDKNRTLHHSSINLRYFYNITHFVENLHFFDLHEKVMLLII